MLFFDFLYNLHYILLNKKCFAKLLLLHKQLCPIIAINTFNSLFIRIILL